jgi:hypothetical protein
VVAKLAVGHEIVNCVHDEVVTGALVDHRERTLEGVGRNATSFTTLTRVGMITMPILP